MKSASNGLFSRVKLGTLIGTECFQNGIYKPASEYGHGTPIIRITNFDNLGVTSLEDLMCVSLREQERSAFALQNDDILINRVNSLSHVGKSCLITNLSGEVVFESNLMRLRLSESSSLNPRFLALVLQLSESRRFLRAVAKPAIAQASVNQGDILAIRVPRALPKIQNEIVEISDLMHAATESASALLSALERRKQGLMQQLLTGRRRLNGFKGKWKSVRFGLFADAARSINTTALALPVLSCTKYAGLVDSLKYFNKRVFSENTATYKIVKRGQFVYATNHIEEGSIGYQDLCDAALVSPLYTVFEPNAEVINHRFLYMLLKTEAMRRVFEATTHSSVDRRGSLRWPEFAKLKISIPPMSEQEQIVTVLETASAAVDLARQQLDELKAQKRALLQKLLSGEWRLPAKPAQGKFLRKKGL